MKQTESKRWYVARNSDKELVAPTSDLEMGHLIVGHTQSWYCPQIVLQIATGEKPLEVRLSLDEVSDLALHLADLATSLPKPHKA